MSLCEIELTKSRAESRFLLPKNSSVFSCLLFSSISKLQSFVMNKPRRLKKGIAYASHCSNFSGGLLYHVMVSILEMLQGFDYTCLTISEFLLNYFPR